MSLRDVKRLSRTEPNSPLVLHLSHPQASDGVGLLKVLSLDMLVHRLRQRHVHGRQRHPFQAGHP